MLDLAHCPICCAEIEDEVEAVWWKISRPMSFIFNCPACEEKLSVSVSTSFNLSKNE